MITSRKLEVSELVMTLFLGKNAFIAKNLDSKVDGEILKVLWFSRGIEGRCGNTIFGDANRLLEISLFPADVQTIVNFSLKKESSIEENIKYINQIFDLGAKLKIKRLIHISSMMVYPDNVELVDETTEIEDYRASMKGKYAKIKMSVDNWIVLNKDKYDFEVCIVRPGFIYDDRVLPRVGFKLFWKVWILFGDKTSKLPVINIDDFQRALIKLCIAKECLDVINLFEPENVLRYRLMLNLRPNILLLTLPKSVKVLLPKVFCKYSSFYSNLYTRLESIYCDRLYENDRSMEFIKQSIK